MYAGSQVLSRELVPSRGFQSCMDNKLIIGLGKKTQIDSMVIRWPNRRYSVFRNPAINRIYTISQLDSPVLIREKEADPQPVFQTLSNDFDKHQEDDYIDFYYERNIPEMLSREGPRAAVGDVNGDGLDDIYIGGAMGQPGQLYLQTPDGNFLKKREKVFDEFAGFEDVAVLFFDADGDGDLDLAIGPGGNNQPPNSREIQLRLYKNDGQGNFSVDANAFPLNDANISTIIANDFNNDGFLDLFVGAANVPRDYGISPASMLLLNDGHGHFTNLLTGKNNDLAYMGMVKDAVWADVLGNGRKQLVVAGEWMAPRIFSWHDNHFSEVNTNLNKLHGWWHCVVATDVNRDGKPDLVLGNTGENFYLRPDSMNPVKLFIGDFDKNYDQNVKIVTRTYEGKDMPVFLKREMTDQFPALRKQNLKHADYAGKTVQELFGADLIQKADVKLFNFSSSIVAINAGNGQFVIEKLPVETQLSSLNSILPVDLKGNGTNVLLTGGNEFDFQPQFGCLDANYGQVLENNGKGVFTCMDQRKSGLTFRAAVRDIKMVNTKKGKKILVLQNDEKPILLGIRP